MTQPSTRECPLSANFRNLTSVVRQLCADSRFWDFAHLQIWIRVADEKRDLRDPH